MNSKKDPLHGAVDWFAVLINKMSGIIAGYTIRLDGAYDQRLIRAHVMPKVACRLSQAPETTTITAILMATKIVRGTA